jgi:hypothetical protein
MQGPNDGRGDPAEGPQAEEAFAYPMQMNDLRMSLSDPGMNPVRQPLAVEGSAGPAGIQNLRQVSEGNSQRVDTLVEIGLRPINGIVIRLFVHHKHGGLQTFRPQTRVQAIGSLGRPSSNIFRTDHQNSHKSPVILVFPLLQHLP